MWKAGDTAPKDCAVLVRSAACVSVAVWSEEWKGWVAHADGFDARDPHGDIVVICAPDYWCEIPDELTV
jgi:hypothetical protein